MDLKLKNKIAMVAASSKGLGYGIAHALAKEGALLSIGSRDKNNYEIAAEKIRNETGAKVIATGSKARFEHILNAGAYHILDYGDSNLVKKVLQFSPGGVDRAIEVEFGENVNLLHQITKPNGSISLFGGAKNMNPTFPFGPYLFKALKINIALIYILPKEDRDQAIKFLHDAHEVGALKLAIGQIFNLEDCADAHDATLTSGRTGSVLIRI